MDGLILLRRARVVGLRVSTQDGKLVVRGPREREGVAKELLAHKAEVLKALSLEASRPKSDLGSCILTADLFGVRTVADLVALESSGPAGGPCFACGGDARWRLRDGGDWVCTRCHPPLPPRKDIETWSPGEQADA